MWDLIVWTDQNGIDFVPSLWRHPEKVDVYKAPQGMSQFKIRQYIFDCKDIDSYTWSPVIVKRSGIKSLDKAKQLCKKGTQTSNIDTSEDEYESDASPLSRECRKRKRKPNKNHYSPFAALSGSDESQDKSQGVVVNASIVRMGTPVPMMSPDVRLSPSAGLSASTVNRQFFTPISHRTLSETNYDQQSGSTATQRNESETTSGITGRQGERILFELSQLRKDFNRLENLVLEKGAQQLPAEIISDPILAALPAETEEQLQHINEEVADDAKLNQLVNMMYLLGGEDCQKTVYLILKKIISKNLATTYSGQGKKKKKPFCQLNNLCGAINLATRKRHPLATDEAIKKYVGLFLATAKSRLRE